MTDERTISPMTGWETGTVGAYGIGLLTIQYLVSPMESLAQAHSTPTFGLTIPQLRELGQKMLELARTLETTPQTASGSPQH